MSYEEKLFHDNNCDYYNIPYRTVTDWEAGKRKMPEYVLELMEFKADVEQLKTASV